MASSTSSPPKLTMGQFFGFFFRILAPEASFYWLAIIYGVGISLLSLATPISVQMLINTVANTALTAPLILLSATLFGLLMISGLLNALRVHLMELFGRRFYARMVAEIALRSIYAQNPFFSDTSRSALFNRYFDIVVVQKSMPVLFIGGFTVILQAGVGFVLVSLYHPLFLVFNLVLVALIWIIWLIWGASAIRSAIDLSHAKHATAEWLESLAASDGFFKSQKRIDYALDRTDDQTCTYIQEHRKHFRRHFAQTLSFLTLYAAASAILLGLGGWLVIQGQLTLGQLVAAELVLSVAFFGVSQLGTYLTYFYDLCAAAEELSLFYAVEQEEPSGDDPVVRHDHTLAFHQVKGEARHQPAHLHLEIPSGAAVMASSSHHGVQRLFTNLLKRHTLPKGGYVTLGGVDLLDLDVHLLRQSIYVIDRSTVIGMTIRDYLNLSTEGNAAQATMQALETVGLAHVVASLKDGLDTHLASTGWPLSNAEVLQLKLAAALVAEPRVLVLNQLFDLLPEDDLSAAIAVLRDQAETTVIYFSNRQVDLGFDTYLFLDSTEQRFYPSFEAFAEAANGHRGPAPTARPLLIEGPAEPTVKEA
ncbi:MAG: ABC transporter ATP-binding protein [Pseudomonadota bacterium]